MKKESLGGQRGLTLVELLIALALVSLTMMLAAVSLSPRDEALRATVRNLRFDLELARHAAISRNATVFVEIDMAPGAKAYTVFVEDLDGNREAIKPPVSLERLRAFSASGSGREELETPLTLAFSPRGGSTPVDLDLESGVERRNRCWVTSSTMELSSTGRVEMSDQDPGWKDREYCDLF